MSCVLNHPTVPDTVSLAFTTDPETGLITMCGLHAEGVQRIGTFRTAAEAWAALDAIDAPRR
jgi:hypothetical protein